jgi:predicted permease
VEPGFAARNVAVIQIFAYGRHDSDDKLRRFHDDVTTGLRQIPGVQDVGVVSAMPLISANINIEGAFAIEGRAPAPSGAQPTGYLTVASPGYFSVMDVPLVEGRVFTEADTPAAVPVVAISRSLARRCWPAGDAVGSWITFRFHGKPQRRQVVGVIGELRHDALDQPSREELFLPFAQVPFAAMTWVMRTGVAPSTVLANAREAIWAEDPLQSIYEENTVAALLRDAVAPRRFVVVLIGVFAVVALLLAAAGVYASMSVATARLTREFGVRMALGATAKDIGGFVLARGLRLAAVGTTGGLILATLATRSIEGQLFGISAFDPITMAGVGLVVVAIAAAASFAPARRAMRVDAAVALRNS